MPRVTATVTGGATPAACYPKLLQGKDSGSIYLLSAAKTGTIVALGSHPWVGPKARRNGKVSKHKIGYYSTRLDESNMRAFTGEVKLAIAAA